VDLAPSNDPHERHPLGLRLARAAIHVRSDLPLLLLDLVVTLAVYLLLIALRFDFKVPGHYWDRFLVFLPIACVVHLGFNALWGCYGRTWRHASIDEAIRLLAAAACSAAVLFAGFSWGNDHVPFTVLLAGPFIVVFLFGLVRFQSRLFAFRRAGYKGTGTRVAIVGAGKTGSATVREMKDFGEHGLVPAVVVDDNPSLRGRTLHGVPVEGPVSQLAAIVRANSASQIVLAITSPPRALVQQVAEVSEQTGTPVRVVRAPTSWIHGVPGVRDLRALGIEDLLGRAQVQVDLEPVRRLIRGKRVLVTGGGGWIGSELARQVMEFAPARVVLLDHDETHLYDAVEGMGPLAETALADIRDATAIDAVFDTVRPEVVLHAAAHKHVPILESYACEAIRTNVFGTLNVVDACNRVGTGHLVCISTDKAATPTNVMGASKWLAEQIVLARAAVPEYCSVRFGNVLGSRGSVIPTFQRQIDGGGPVTVTDPRMTRYFMSTAEASRLVLVAAATASDGDARRVLALEMGEQVNIKDLAERMIRLCGLKPDEDIEIVVTGPRPGEKLREVVVGPGEHVDSEAGSSAVIAIVPVALDPSALADALDGLEALAATGDHDAARDALLAITEPAIHPSLPDSGHETVPQS
jgi:FlaA1/EpsC-like NDP-sugar epimerase